jgi:hypothetical protein
LLIDNGLRFCDLAPDPEMIGDRLHDSMWSGIGRR